MNLKHTRSDLANAILTNQMLNKVSLVDLSDIIGVEISELSKYENSFLYYFMEDEKKGYIFYESISKESFDKITEFALKTFDKVFNEREKYWMIREAWSVAHTNLRKSIANHEAINRGEIPVFSSTKEDIDKGESQEVG